MDSPSVVIDPTILKQFRYEQGELHLEIRKQQLKRVKHAMPIAGSVIGFETGWPAFPDVQTFGTVKAVHKTTLRAVELIIKPSGGFNEFWKHGGH